MSISSCNKLITTVLLVTALAACSTTKTSEVKKCFTYQPPVATEKPLAILTATDSNVDNLVLADTNNASNGSVVIPLK